MRYVVIYKNSVSFQVVWISMVMHCVQLEMNLVAQAAAFLQGFRMKEREGGLLFGSESIRVWHLYDDHIDLAAALNTFSPRRKRAGLSCHLDLNETVHQCIRFLFFWFMFQGISRTHVSRFWVLLFLLIAQQLDCYFFVFSPFCVKLPWFKGKRAFHSFTELVILSC